jgi:ECF transporter S component (folate family)
MKEKTAKYLTFEFNVKTLATEGMLLAAFVVLDIYSLKIGEGLKFNFAFLPVAISGALFGPLWTCLLGVSGDLIGCIFTGQAPFWQLTLTAGLQGLLYGVLLFGKSGKALSAFSAIAKAADTVFISLLINTNILISYGLVSSTLPGWYTRIGKAAIELPVYAIFLAVLMPRITEIYGKIIKNKGSKSNEIRLF